MKSCGSTARGLKPCLELRPDAALKGPLFHVGLPA